MIKLRRNFRAIDEAFITEIRRLQTEAEKLKLEGKPLPVAVAKPV
jgi:hypothetical protein